MTAIDEDIIEIVRLWVCQNCGNVSAKPHLLDENKECYVCHTIGHLQPSSTNFELYTLDLVKRQVELLKKKRKKSMSKKWWQFWK